uniref:SFRICE_000801 n=1 Tax=Spodoptera frugiperda TaxID=7108 RepID=A0A2H1VHR1_SPOFR
MLYSSSASTSTALPLCGLIGLRREGEPAGLGLGVGGFSRASSSASVSCPLYQSALEIEIAFVSISQERCNSFGPQMSLIPIQTLATIQTRQYLNTITIKICHLPFGNLPGPLASLVDVIEGLAQLAAGATGCVTVDAHVEELAVFRVSVPRVGQTEGLVHRGTVEGEHLCEEKLYDIIIYVDRNVYNEFNQATTSQGDLEVMASDIRGSAPVSKVAMYHKRNGYYAYCTVGAVAGCPAERTAVEPSAKKPSSGQSFVISASCSAFLSFSAIVLIGGLTGFLPLGFGPAADARTEKIRIFLWNVDNDIYEVIRLSRRNVLRPPIVLKLHLQTEQQIDVSPDGNKQVNKHMDHDGKPKHQRRYKCVAGLLKGLEEFEDCWLFWYWRDCEEGESLNAGCLQPAYLDDIGPMFSSDNDDD